MKKTHTHTQLSIELQEFEKSGRIKNMSDSNEFIAFIRFFMISLNFDDKLIEKKNIERNLTNAKL